MSSKQHLGMAILLLVMLTGIGGLLLVWPAYRDTAWMNTRVTDLRSRSQNVEAQTQVIAKLTGELDEISARVDAELKRIPSTPDIAGLMRVLSLPVDKKTVFDQALAAGEPREAVPGANFAEFVQPVKVEMSARFDAIFALLKAAESMKRLLRIQSVRIEADRRSAEEQPIAKATIVIEAVYEPKPAGGRAGDGGEPMPAQARMN